ncbi:MAG: ABC transporter ATP-binding protein [Candidatus Aminicenantes bacterium]|nr:ABC transporter ATP-binding protein [Candidatus Aminicenantes bacterium]
MNDQEWTLEATGIKKVYKRGSEDIPALDGISLKIRRGEFVSFTGPSGSGKTTLINILGCLDNATSGSLILGGRTIFTESQNLSEAELTKIRRSVFGYIFQKFYLLPTLTVLENVVLPHTFFRKEGATKDPQEILRSLGMGKRLNHLPGQLSGGEMQRVAIARALVNNPDILLADEPTGNLDSKRSQEIGEVIQSLNQREGLTVLLVTHNLALAKLAGRTVELQDGKLRDGDSPSFLNS